MKLKTYNYLPQCAMDIRMAVFVEEQGFRDELDATDDVATHLVLFDGDKAIATCRVFWNEEKESYVLGRLAVLREYRGRKIGSEVLMAAEEYVASVGEDSLILHSQCRAKDFYEKRGYVEYGEIEEEEGCPHIWMRKTVK